MRILQCDKCRKAVKDNGGYIVEWYSRGDQEINGTNGEMWLLCNDCMSALMCFMEDGCTMEYCEEASGDEICPTEVYQCSHCGFYVDTGKTRYCPNCGLKVANFGGGSDG